MQQTYEAAKKLPEMVEKGGRYVTRRGRVPKVCCSSDSRRRLPRLRQVGDEGAGERERTSLY
jgi:hypothetical protein